MVKKMDVPEGSRVLLAGPRAAEACKQLLRAACRDHTYVVTAGDAEDWLRYATPYEGPLECDHSMIVCANSYTSHYDWFYRLLRSKSVKVMYVIVEEPDFVSTPLMSYFTRVCATGTTGADLLWKLYGKGVPRSDMKRAISVCARRGQACWIRANEGPGRLLSPHELEPEPPMGWLEWLSYSNPFRSRIR